MIFNKRLSLLVGNIVAGLLAGHICAAQSGVKKIAVSDPRPLAQAALELEKQVGMPINYEDIPYLWSGDVVDVADQVMRPEQRAMRPTHRVLIPKGGQLSISLPTLIDGPQQSTTVRYLLDQLVSAQTASKLSGEYTVQESGGAFFVLPKKALDAFGSSVSVQSVLETRVTFPFASRSGLETLQEIFRQVGQNGRAVLMGTVPLNGMAHVQISMGATGQSARELISQVLREMGSVTMNGVSVPCFSYRLFFDPGAMSYVFNVHRVEGL